MADHTSGFSGRWSHISLTVKTKKETKIYKDVLIGEVWLCSGQSNMQFRVRQAINAKYEMHRANNPCDKTVKHTEYAKF